MSTGDPPLSDTMTLREIRYRTFSHGWAFTPKSLKTDRLIVVKVHRQCCHRRPERRSRLQALGHRRQKLLLAARANPAMTPNLRDHWLDRRYLDPLVELFQRLALRRHRRRAVWVGLGYGDMGMVGGFAQLSADPRMRAASHGVV